MDIQLPDTKLWLSDQQAFESANNGTGEGVKIAIIDSGVDFSHPWLKDLKIFDNYIFSDLNQARFRESETPFDPNGHGTAIASVVHQVAPKAEIGSFRVFDRKEKRGNGVVIRRGVEKALSLGYDIINCSFGIPGRHASGATTFIAKNKQWVDQAFHSGQHIVAACNNSNHDAIEWPGHFTSVITVDGINCEADELYWRRGEAAYLRNDGLEPEVAWFQAKQSTTEKTGHAEFGAKGVDVEVAYKDHSIRRLGGSSFAAPRVAGIMARILSEHPFVDPLQMKALLRLIACERRYFRFQSGRELSRVRNGSTP